MISQRQHLGLPRQVVAWYLFFCLAAVCWLATGLLDAAHGVVTKRNATVAIARLHRSVAAIETAHRANEQQPDPWSGMQGYLAQLRGEGRFVYCSLLDLEGKSIADTREDRIGQFAVELAGTPVEEAGVWGVHALQPSGVDLTEYRIPLNHGGEQFATLSAAVQSDSSLASIVETISAAPSAVVLPLLLIVVGGVLLGRLTRSAATVETQLSEIAQLPAGEPPEMFTVPPGDLAALGWNRVVGHLDSVLQQRKTGTLDERIAALASGNSNDQLAEALGSLSEGIALTDMEGRLRFANAALAALLDTDEKAAKDIEFEKHLLNCVDQLSDTEVFSEENDRRLVTTEATREVNGKTHILRVVRQPNRSGQESGHVWTLRDITQQKLAEQTRDRFLDAATHELRTPLSNIKAYAETLASEDELEVEKQKEFCNVINSEVTRLSRFVDDLLSISSMEVGSLSVDLRPTEMERLFEEVLDKVRPLLGQKGHTLNVQLPEKLGEMKIDKDKVVAVLVNLLGNAAKYTPRGGHIGFKVKREEDGLRIAVEDTGVGISEAEASQVFDKFFRSDDPRVQAETGSGLGLSLAQEVAHMHGGEVTCESVLNEGTTFTLHLPEGKEAANARR
ncbi:sensor histidine kinase [Adhaeretor mobilis]|uniref:histidine kinase n=1 Tax=Adhaeretor mobilis TaxID=1930276 RepID=A0A517MVP1_9BACT|nr:ATP-binding protein [Adhaeretor mobilis]QDS98943.1 Sensor histidine kinase YycG [Adhaeretor mobilis]